MMRIQKCSTDFNDEQKCWMNSFFSFLVVVVVVIGAPSKIDLIALDIFKYLFRVSWHLSKFRLANGKKKKILITV